MSWAKEKEKGSIFLMKFVLLIFKLLGRRITLLISRIICFYYYLFAKKQRSFSNLFISRYQSYCKSMQLETRPISSLSHISSFGEMIVDKLSVWNKKIKRSDLNEKDLIAFKKRCPPGQGAVFLSSHFGNIEITRAIGQLDSNIKFNALIYHQGSQKIFSILRSLSPHVDVNIIAVDKVSPTIGTLLKEKIEKGEWVFLAADRIPVNSSKNFELDFLGEKALFPRGPFILASLLKAPIFAFHCYKEGKCFRLDTVPLSFPIKSRDRREESLLTLAKAYTKVLERLVLNAPKQWYNFYDFWNKNVI